MLSCHVLFCLISSGVLLTGLLWSFFGWSSPRLVFSRFVWYLRVLSGIFASCLVYRSPVWSTLVRSRLISCLVLSRLGLCCLVSRRGISRLFWRGLGLAGAASSWLLLFGLCLVGVMQDDGSMMERGESNNHELHLPSECMIRNMVARNGVASSRTPRQTFTRFAYAFSSGTET